MLKIHQYKWNLTLPLGFAMTVEGHTRDNLPHAHGTIWLKGAQSPQNMLRLISKSSPDYDEEYCNRFIKYIDQHLCASCPGMSVAENADELAAMDHTFVSAPWTDYNSQPPRIFMTRIEIPNTITDAPARLKKLPSDPHPSAWHPPILTGSVADKKARQDFDHSAIALHTCVHTHTATCYVEDVKKRAVQPCRLNLPLSKVEETHWDSLHCLKVKRSHDWMNMHSAAVLSICRINCDFKMGDPSSDSRAWRFYTTKYQTKYEENKAMRFCLSAAILRFTKRAAKSNNALLLPKQIEDRRKVQLLESVLFETQRKTDVTSVEVNRTLARIPEFYNSHDYRGANYNALLAAQQQWYNQEGYEDIADIVRLIDVPKPGAQSTVQKSSLSKLILKNNIIGECNVVEDYIHRPECIQELNLYEYITYYEKIDKKNSKKHKTFRFAETHPEYKKKLLIFIFKIPLFRNNQWPPQKDESDWSRIVLLLFHPFNQDRGSFLPKDSSTTHFMEQLLRDNLLTEKSQYHIVNIKLLQENEVAAEIQRAKALIDTERAAQNKRQAQNDDAEHNGENEDDDETTQIEYWMQTMLAQAQAKAHGSELTAAVTETIDNILIASIRSGPVVVNPSPLITTFDYQMDADDMKAIKKGTADLIKAPANAPTHIEHRAPYTAFQLREYGAEDDYVWNSMYRWLIVIANSRTLNKEQREVFYVVMSDILQDYLKAQPSIMRGHMLVLLGKAGTGKTTTLAAIEEAMAGLQLRDAYLITATTGAAAVQLHSTNGKCKPATTLHSQIGWTRQKKQGQIPKKLKTGETFPSMVTVDEISAAGLGLLGQTSIFLRGRGDPAQRLGNARLLACGDFNQTLPVRSAYPHDYARYLGEEGSETTVLEGAHLWNEVEYVFQLHKANRTKDERLLIFLNKLRTESLLPLDMQPFHDRVLASEENPQGINMATLDASWNEAVFIVEENKLRDTINRKHAILEARKREKPCFIIPAINHIGGKNKIQPDEHVAEYLAGIPEAAKLPAHNLHLFEGMEIVFMENHSAAHKVANGAVGWVHKIIRHDLDQAVAVDGLITCSYPPKCVLVEVPNGKFHINGLPPNIWPIFSKTFQGEIGQNHSFSRTQFPLSNSKAVTPYKAQGRTIKKVILAMIESKKESKLLEAYVALSRVANLDDMLVMFPFLDTLVEARLSSGLKAFMKELDDKATATRLSIERLLPAELLADTIQFPVSI